MSTKLLRLRLSTIFLLVSIAALVVRFVVEPEIRRTETFATLHEKNAIHAPIVTMFSGGPPNYDPMPEPAWFTTRQRVAKLFGITTIPWHGNCRLEFIADKNVVFELASSCDDLGLFVNREYDYAELQAEYARNY